ncbi:GntR family transcriptional regulator [Pseudovibrio flavus]|uniref:GntR family transcriptional regulator n=1 Tax=Pseudovibrio flavus TaxID=2529854 RepID=UPI003527D6EA
MALYPTRYLTKLNDLLDQFWRTSQPAGIFRPDIMLILETKTKRLYQELAEQIESDLQADSSRRAGDKIPSERELSERYSVSRTTVREALIMLELTGLVEVKKGSGVFYLGPRAGHTSIDPSSIGPFELLQARQTLESAIAELAASNISTTQIRELREITAQAEVDSFNEELDKRFHVLIAEGTHNNMLIKAANDLWDMRKANTMWDKMHARISNLEAHRKAWQLDHLEILHALMRRSPQDTKQAVWKHLENVKTALFDASDVEDPDFDGFVFARSE